MQRKIYTLQGLTCAGCSRKLEAEINALSGVDSATINFTAAKLIISGNYSKEELAQVAAARNIILATEASKQPNSASVWNSLARPRLLIAFLALLAGIFTGGAVSTLFLAGAIVIGGYTLFIKGFRHLIKLEFDMNALMSIAVIGAAFLQEWLEGATVVLLFALSEALERYSMQKARNSISSLMELAPTQALILHDNVTKLVDVEEVAIGDIMIVKPGQKIALDGVVISGSSSVNQAAITGESMPVDKQVDDEVFAGTLNVGGMLEIRVTKLVADTTMAKIITLIEEAESQKAPSATFIDKFAKYYTPAILLISLLIILVPPLLLDGSWHDSIYRGLSLLVIGCPCALVISTPIAIVTAIGVAAKRGILIKGGLYLEALRKITVMAFDKTGTLTQGEPTVTRFISYSAKQTEQELASIAAALEGNSSHPIAHAILAYDPNHKKENFFVSDFQEIGGKGITAKVNDVVYYLGSPAFMLEQKDGILSPEQLRQVEALQKEGNTVIALGTKTELLALIAIADQLRESSHKAIEELKKLDIRETIMLTGDNKATGEYIGQKVGMTQVKAELLPDQKLEAIQEFQQQGHKIAMVGDGINDAPALALADVGIAMSGGTDTALETSDIVLMGNDLKQLPIAVRLSRKTLAVIKQNISVALGIKLIALMLIIPDKLTLWMALFADMGSTVIVTLNSLRLIKSKK